MPAVVPEIVRATPKNWAFMGNHTWGALDAQVWVLGTAIPSIAAYGTNIIVDGLSFAQTNLSANVEYIYGQVYACTRGGNAVVHQLDSISIPATKIGAKACVNLGISSEITNDRLMTIYVYPVAALDNVLFTCWGRYEPSPSSDPIPVNVQEFHLSPPKKPRGPI